MAGRKLGLRQGGVVKDHLGEIADTVAALDGLSEDEREFAVELGARMGLPATLVLLLIAEGQANALAMQAGSREMSQALIRMREALYDFAFEPPINGELADVPRAEQSLRLPKVDMSVIDDDDHD